MTVKPYCKPELLAPAGDLLRCKTAIRYGADAVYIGGKHYSLRSRASNFDLHDIQEACAFAKAYGASIHVTVNEIPHDTDFEGLEEYLKALEEAGVKAIIAASPYIMRLCHKTAPKLEVHCSTQLSVTNSDAASAIAKMTGADRIVLARECTLEEVRAIRKRCDTPLEVFIHGGMCVNCSGRCTLSNRMTLRDANRGGCAQSCRWHYDVFGQGMKRTTDNTLFTLGSKDLCALDVLEELMKTGIASFKIEGRMKTEYYVASVVSAYRHLIDELYETDGPLSDERLAFHAREIMAAENRDTCAGNYYGPGGAESIIYHAHSDADVNHAFLGTVVSFEQGELVLETRNPIDPGDRIEVLSPGMENRVFVCASMKDEEGNLMEKSRVPMRLVHMPVPFEVRKGDLLRKELS